MIARLGLVVLAITLAAVAVLSLQLSHARRHLSQLEQNDRAQTRQITKLVDIASTQEQSLENSTSLVGQVIDNQQRLANLYKHTTVRRLSASR